MYLYVNLIWKNKVWIVSLEFFPLAYPDHELNVKEAIHFKF